MPELRWMRLRQCLWFLLHLGVEPKFKPHEKSPEHFGFIRVQVSSSVPWPKRLDFCNISISGGLRKVDSQSAESQHWDAPKPDFTPVLDTAIPGRLPGLWLACSHLTGTGFKKLGSSYKASRAFFFFLNLEGTQSPNDEESLKAGPKSGPTTS